MKINLIKSILLLTLVILSKNIYCQNVFSFSARSGIIFPSQVFYRGFESSANKERECSKHPGLVAILSSSMKLNSDSKLNANFNFERFSYTLKEFGIWPSDISASGISQRRSFSASDFSNKNIGIGSSYSHKLTDKIWLESGIQFSIPLNENTGYEYFGGLDKITDHYTYETKNKIGLVSSLEIQLLSKKNLDFSLYPGLTFYLSKTPKTTLQNQFNLYYFSMLLGIRFK
jgi:hypothetical protein